MHRIYDELVQFHLNHFEEMLFLSGPRQVGKTTVSEHVQSYATPFTYLNWDNDEHKVIILSGAKDIMAYSQTNMLSSHKPVIVLDEIHKCPDWKNFLKGFFDTYGKKIHLIVSGSARLDIYQKGGDSLMGRYFPYRMHPLSVAECIRTQLLPTEIAEPRAITPEDFNALWQFGGYPKPFLTRASTFHLRWTNLRKQQLIQEDIRDVNVIHDLNRLRLLTTLFEKNATQLINYSTIAKLIKASVDTVTRWIEVLESFYYCYRLRPWSKNITRSLIKEPKIFLWDWSVITDPGARAENFVASHLLKATHYWTDRGLGVYELFFLRTTDKKEVDFLVTKNEEPWFLVEVKYGNNQGISPHLHEFQQKTRAPFAFQVNFGLPFVEKDCFSVSDPVIVPAKTLLSQLV
jgi:predicted AAA+ superfamily ATPase